MAAMTHIPSAPVSVLVVDESPAVLAALHDQLGSAGLRVQTSDNPFLVAHLLGQGSFDILLLDVDMPAVKGPEVVAALRRHDCLNETQVVLYSGATDPVRLQELGDRCGVAAIPKSVVGAELVDRLVALAGGRRAWTATGPSAHR